MKYSNIFAAEFVSRPNRFIANVMFGTNTVVHVKNTGRCKELLVPGTEVYIQKADNEKRKTEYDLIAVKKETEFLILIHLRPIRLHMIFCWINLIGLQGK